MCRLLCRLGLHDLRNMGRSDDGQRNAMLCWDCLHYEEQVDRDERIAFPIYPF